MLEAGITIQLHGPPAAKDIPDLTSGQPFEYARTPGGFDLRSKLTGRDGKPVAMRFGK
jgi:hypothetical protein